MDYDNGMTIGNVQKLKIRKKNHAQHNIMYELCINKYYARRGTARARVSRDNTRYIISINYHNVVPT